MAQFQPIHPRRPEPGSGGFATASLFTLPAAGEAEVAAALAEAAAQRAREAEAAAALGAAHEAGRQDGYAAGRSAGLAEAAQRDAARLAAAAEAAARALREACGAARAAAVAHAEEAAEALARLLLAALDAALPEAAARDAGPRLAALIESLRPALAEEPRILVRVAPDLAGPLAEHLPGAGEGFEVAADAALAPGDARVEWRGGAAEMVLERRRRAVRAALIAAGLGE